MTNLSGLFLFLNKIDWILLSLILSISCLGIITMDPFVFGDIFWKQTTFLIFAVFVFVFIQYLDLRSIKKTSVIMILFSISISLLLLVFLSARAIKGAKSWFELGFFSFQPAEFVKFVLVLILAKFFSKRHIEISNIKHILISGIYASIIFFLLLLQPDFGSAMIIFFIWLGMVFVSGVSKKHLFAIFLIGAISFSFLWTNVFKEYQKNRILTFINPTEDIRGAGYNAYQSMIAVGSGQLLGKGIGYGTQSKLKFLPEYKTDFIVAAYAEEWGFVGIVILFLLFSLIIFKILKRAYSAGSNFEILLGFGIAIILISQAFINIGMNIGLLPVTGLAMPFMSYGGTHILIEFISIGILFSLTQDKTGLGKVNNSEFIGPN